MFRIISIFILSAVCFIPEYIQAKSGNSAKSQEIIPYNNQDIRMFQAMPDHLRALGMDFALPEDFCVGLKDGEIFFGKEMVLKRFFKNPKDIRGVIISSSGFEDNFKLSDKFNYYEDKEEFMAGVRQEGVEPLNVQRIRWGSHKGFTFEAYYWKENAHLALLYGPNKQPVQFAMLPTNDGFTPESLKIWENFIANTEPFSDEIFFLICGMNLQEGCTIWAMDQVKFKAIAEKRVSDNKLVVILEPLNPLTEVVIKGEVKYANWKKGKQSVHLPVTVRNERENQLYDQGIIVLIKDVEEFTIDPEKAKHKAHMRVREMTVNPQNPEMLAVEKIKG